MVKKIERRLDFGQELFKATIWPKHPSLLLLIDSILAFIVDSNCSC